ncbi:unnamed protein product [Colias eurytheme]|nr:unnamed protein product [Colias eurytheme]
MDSIHPIKYKILNWLRVIIAGVARFIFSIFSYCRKKKIPPIHYDILKQPAIEVARKIRNKEITSVEVLEACIKRIIDVNSALNCLIENRYDEALKEAKEADSYIRSGIKSEEQLLKEKPFLGVPFTTKDSISVKGLHNTAGIYSARHNIADNDAKVIKLLRDKGAIIIGITNVPELCLWWESYNKIYGRSNNPYDTTKIVGGSSGGEGALQAAAGSCFGIGSDIGGSIRMPAFFNGIFGHKPTRKIVSNDGQFPEVQSEQEDACLAIGPMTRHAVDLKPLLNIISGENGYKLKLDQPVDMRKLKVYYQTNNHAPLTDPVDHEIASALKKVIRFFETKHEVTAAQTNITLLQKSTPIWYASTASEKKISSYIMEDGDGSDQAIIKEIIKSICGRSDKTLVILLTALADNVDLKSDAYRENRMLAEKLENMFKEMLGEDGVFIFPTHPTAALYHNEPLFRPYNFSYTSIFNSLGFPATAVPLGLNRSGLPIGVQVIANHNNDRLCLAVAEELEKEFGGWVEPQRRK